MSSPDVSPNALTDEEIAVMMQRQVMRNAIIFPREGVPLSETFERSRRMLPEHIRDSTASRLRCYVTASILREPIPKDIDPVDHTSLDSKDVQSTFAAEIDWMEAHPDENSPAYWMLLSDLYGEYGNTVMERDLYRKAIKLAREQGLSLHE